MAASGTENVIRSIRREDAPALAALEARCDGAAKWCEAAYREAESNGSIGWAVQRDQEISGFILVRTVADEMEILNFAVDPEARRQRIGSGLLSRAIEEARQVGVEQIHLEVRESNAGARRFYLSAGFTEHGRRKNYYSQPVEDAVLMVLRVQ
jgi:ribosomal-protein-alanine N-acetyltransferase